MKHLFTKLLLVLAIVFGVSVAQAADFYLRGGANIMGEDAEFGWQAASSAELTVDASGSVYFWANGDFKISYKTGDWDAFNSGCFVINANNNNSVEFKNDDTNLGSDKKYVKLTYTGDNSEGGKKNPNYYKIEVQDNLFTQDPAQLADLYIGGSWNDSWASPAKFDVEENSYKDFEFKAVNGNQFRFYTDQRGAYDVNDKSTWMGASGNNLDVVSGSTYTTGNNAGFVYTVREDGIYVIHVTEYNANAKTVKFTITKKETVKPLYIAFSSDNWAIKQIDCDEDSYFAYEVDAKQGEQFRFHSASNGGNYMGPSNGNLTINGSDGTEYVAEGNGNKFVFDSDGHYTIKVISYNGVNTVKFTVVKSSEAYNNSLFVGIASSNRHQIQPAAGGGYAEYKFYVNEADLKDSEFGFRFYSEPNAGVWMGCADEKTAIEYGKEYTTTGIKRYWINEVGAYSIKVKSYDPVKNQVIFSITKLEGDVVLEPLYIGGTWDNTLEGGEKTKIESQYGKYKPFQVTVPANSQFLFFSANDGGNNMGAVLADGTIVDSKGTLPFTTQKGSNKFKFFEAGKYEINVSEYIPESRKVTFTAKLISGGSVVEVKAPQTLYMRNSRDGWSNVVPMTYDAESNSFSTKVSLAKDGVLSFHFYEHAASDWSSRGTVYYPAGGDQMIGNYPKFANYQTVSSDPNAAWKIKSSEDQEVTISVIFGNGAPVVKVNGALTLNYYFIGDLNDWFSNEFDGELGKDDIYEQKIVKGINSKRWEMNSENWQFEYVGDGWYRFNKFPEGLLTGHFQILTEASWVSGEVYSHMVEFSSETITDELYKTFKMNRITRDDIREGREYRIRKRPSGNGVGLNLGTQCSAVENAVLYFYPGNGVDVPRIRLEGTPKDYFIFYNMEESEDLNADYKTDADGNNNEYWVRAKINSGKPNTNNYFLAGIEYNGKPLPFFDINGNSGAHMNLNDGIDLAPYALKDLTEVELNDLFFGQKDIVQSILNEVKLPNGRDISGYDNVWVAKIPSGFENPAGTKYNMTFTKAMTEADRNRSTTITPRHLYFFPQVDGVHVHINTDDITEKLSNVESVDVAYRVYKTDNNYNTIAILHGNDVDNGRATKMLHPAGSVMSLTEKSETREIGWYELVRKDDSLWGSPSHPGYNDTEWMVSWDPAVSDAETAAEATDCRREIPYDDNSAFVQFRLTINLKTPLAVPGRSNAPVKSYTVYVPDRVDFGNDKYHFSFNNNDLYVKPLADSDAVWTEVNQIIDEINGNVDPGTFETVYYNLQGVRVDNPTSGVYIRVRGNKSDKVVF